MYDNDIGVFQCFFVRKMLQTNSRLMTDPWVSHPAISNKLAEAEPHGTTHITGLP